MSNNNPGQINFTVEQVTKLLAMQDELNTYIHPEWKKQNFDWNFAIIDEVREIKEHLGWKWWKENYKCGLTDANRKQVQLEVIDILHFVLSVAAQYHMAPDITTKWLNRSYRKGEVGVQSTCLGMLMSACSDTLLKAVTRSDVIYECWHDLAVATGLTTEQVLETYVQKYVLNKFRQDHGYKDGSYCKMWRINTELQIGLEETIVPLALEDNEVLEQVVEHLITNSKGASDENALYTELEVRYNSRLNK